MDFDQNKLWDLHSANFLLFLTNDDCFRWYASLGMCDVAVKHMLEVLACGHQSKTKQELFLGDFLQIVQVIVAFQMLRTF